MKEEKGRAPSLSATTSTAAAGRQKKLLAERGSWETWEPPSGVWPVVSVHIVTCERLTLLLHALRLVAGQDYPKDSLEVVIVDDSRLSAEAAIEDVRSMLPRLAYRYVGPERLSIGAKRNIAASASCGEYIVHWDDDDWFSANRVRAQVMPLVLGVAPATMLRPAAIYSVEFDRYYAADAVAMICTMCYPRTLWRREDARFQYADMSMNEDDWFFGNVHTELGLDFLALRPEITPFVYVKHCDSTVEFTRLGARALAVRMGLRVIGIPAYMPLATRDLWATLRSKDAEMWLRSEELVAERDTVRRRVLSAAGLAPRGGGCDTEANRAAHFAAVLGGDPASAEDFEGRVLELAELLHPDYEGGDARSYERLEEARTFFEESIYGAAGRPCTGAGVEVSWKI